MVATQHIFLPEMLKMEDKGAIVNLGEGGITTPPGFAAYNASKAAVKVLTEQLSHQLLKETGTRLTAHLLVPGYTWTDMNDQAWMSAAVTKPDEAWTAAQVIDYFRALSVGISISSALITLLPAKWMPAHHVGRSGYAGQPPGPVTLAP
jgi:NAD(P)-dependent dehydrogenase (short-subunit alcohol dehydrogenase family)